MNKTLRLALYATGLVIYLISFALPATDTAMPGYLVMAASMEMAEGMVLNIFHFQSAASNQFSALEGFALIATALVNVFFLFYAVASLLLPRNPAVFVSRLLIPLLIPFSWVVLHHYAFTPATGHFAWILGMLLVLSSGYSISPVNHRKNSAGSRTS